MIRQYDIQENLKEFRRLEHSRRRSGSRVEVGGCHFPPKHHGANNFPPKYIGLNDVVSFLVMR
jgi:hypothetical protein